MSLTLRIATLLALVPGGVYTGICVCIAVERTSVWDRLPVEQYAVDFRRSVLRVDPLQPILAVLTLAGTILLAVDHGGSVRTLAIAAAAINLVVFAASVTVAEPMNSQFRKRAEGEVPPGAEAIRRRWKRFHLARTAAAVAMLVLLAIASGSA